MMMTSKTPTTIPFGDDSFLFHEDSVCVQLDVEEQQTTSTTTGGATTTTAATTMSKTSILGSRKLGYSVSHRSNETQLHDPNSKCVPLNKEEQEKCEKLQNAEFKVKLCQQLNDDITDKQREGVQTRSIKCACEELEAMLANNQSEQKPFSLKKKIAVLIIALLLMTRVTITSCSGSVGVDAATIPSVAWQQQQHFCRMMSDSHVVFLCNDRTSTRQNNDVREFGSSFVFPFRCDASNQTDGIVFKVVKQELHTMHLAIDSSLCLSKAVAPSAGNDAEQDSSLMTDDSCSHFDA